MNIKSIITFLVLAGYTVLQLQAQELKVGYTNVEMILAYMPESASVEKKLEEKGKDLEGRIIAKQKYAQVLYDEWVEREQNKKWTSEDEKMKSQNEIMKLEEEIQKATRDAEDALLVYQQQLMEPLITKLQKAIDEVAAEQKFTYILNQTSGMNILYGLETFDVTKQIAAKLKIEIPQN